jgi:formylglycine-generating enzyme required for sulfatase activity
MMRAATRRNLVRLSGVLAAVVALVLLAGLWRDTVVTRTTVDRLLQAETADVPRILEELRGGRGFARRLLTAAADDPGLPAKQRLHAHLALLPEDPSRVDFLADAALQAGPDQLRVIADSLRPFGGGLAETYWRVLQDHQRPGGERLRAAALLADFAPADPRWRDQAGSLASHLVAASPLEAARWQPLLRPARPWLIGPLESAFLSRDAGEAARAVAAALLADYAADDPARLVELLTSADRRSFPPLLAALRPHGGAAVERLSSALARGPEARWVDEPVATGAVPGRAVAAALEAGGGLLGERFAFAAALPMADLDRLAGELARFGYRPCCFRPDGARAAVTWVRDGRKWEWLRDATAEAVRARDAACRRRGLLPADVAWTAGGFAALWVEPTPDLAEAELYVDVPEELHEKHWAPLNEREFVPRTDLITSDGAGRPRYTSVRWKLRRAPMQYLDTWGDDARDFAARVALGFCQVDVRLVRDPGGGEPRLGGAWWNGYGPESRVSPVLPVEGHSRWCRDQAAQGFRPVAVSAGGDAVVSLWLRPLPAEAERDAAARRQALAAVALLHLGRPQAAWERLRLSPEPRVRGWLTHALSETCADPALLLDRLGAEPDVSARRALLRALAEYPPAALDGDRVSALAAALLRTDPDPGVHSAAELLLRRLRPGDEARAPGAPPAPDRDWFRNGEGQTFAVVRGPVEFLMGSPGDEPNRATYDEPRRPVRIGHGFAVATTEVTVEQFLRYCRANAIALNVAYDYTPDLTCPVTMITWHEAAAYCNWLSEREGLPPCYEPDPDARPTGPDVGQVRPMRPKKDQLVLTGYRMPTEAEWEVACRAGTTTGRYYGFAEALLGRYAWTAANSGYRSWPVGRLLPNDLGLFDVLGNAMEFCDDIPRAGGKPDPGRRVIRGGAFLYEPSAARSAHHDTGPAAGLPADRKPYQGFRLVRTLD